MPAHGRPSPRKSAQNDKIHCIFIHPIRMRRDTHHHVHRAGKLPGRHDRHSCPRPAHIHRTSFLARWLHLRPRLLRQQTILDNLTQQ